MLFVLPAFAAGLLFGIAIPVLGGSASSKVTNLLTAALSTDFTPGREVLIDLVEIPPNQKLDRHWHPGEEFHYYLEGNPVIQRADAPPIIGKSGTVGRVEFKQRHQATAGNGGRGFSFFASTPTENPGAVSTRPRLGTARPGSACGHPPTTPCSGLQSDDPFKPNPLRRLT
jgi:quercetin dioxygenase-like cupin family protein